MTLEELLGKLWGLIEIFGPWVLGVGVLIFILAFSLIIWVFISIIRDSRDINRRWRNRL